MYVSNTITKFKKIGPMEVLFSELAWILIVLKVKRVGLNIFQFDYAYNLLLTCDLRLLIFNDDNFIFSPNICLESMQSSIHFLLLVHFRVEKNSSLSILQYFDFQLCVVWPWAAGQFIDSRQDTLNTLECEMYSTVWVTYHNISSLCNNTHLNCRIISIICSNICIFS